MDLELTNKEAMMKTLEKDELSLLQHEVTIRVRVKVRVRMKTPEKDELSLLQHEVTIRVACDGSDPHAIC